MSKTWKSTSLWIYLSRPPPPPAPPPSIAAGGISSRGGEGWLSSLSSWLWLKFCRFSGGDPMPSNSTYVRLLNASASVIDHGWRSWGGFVWNGISWRAGTGSHFGSSMLHRSKAEQGLHRSPVSVWNGCDSGSFWMTGGTTRLSASRQAMKQLFHSFASRAVSQQISRSAVPRCSKWTLLSEV